MIAERAAKRPRPAEDCRSAQVERLSRSRVSNGQIVVSAAPTVDTTPSGMTALSLLRPHQTVARCGR
jgi:hypothetical protein